MIGGLVRILGVGVGGVGFWCLESESGSLITRVLDEVDEDWVAEASNDDPGSSPESNSPGASNCSSSRFPSISDILVTWCFRGHT